MTLTGVARHRFGPDAQDVLSSAAVVAGVATAALTFSAAGMSRHAAAPVPAPAPYTIATKAPPLTWGPPPLVNPIVVNVPTTFYSGSFPTNRDVELVMPRRVRTSSMVIAGGHDVELIGGATTLSATPQGTAALRFEGTSGAIFIEGTSINVNGRSDDGIDVAGSTAAPYTLRPDVYVENVRITGLNGSAAGNHSDLLQAQGSLGRIFIDKLTGQSNYQGIFIPPQFPITSATISRVNLAYARGGQPYTYLLWLLDPGTAETPYPVTLSQVWIAPRAGQSVDANAVAPWRNARSAGGAPIGAVSQGAGTFGWPSSMRVSGVVSQGAPAAGDFVPSAAVGLNYVSPGYATSSGTFASARTSSTAGKVVRRRHGAPRRKVASGHASRGPHARRLRRR
jgi:hypothetical protein